MDIVTPSATSTLSLPSEISKRGEKESLHKSFILLLKYNLSLVSFSVTISVYTSLRKGFYVRGRTSIVLRVY